MPRVDRSGIEAALDLVASWEARWGERPPAAAVDPDRWATAWEEFERRMDGNFPFFHPRFAGQMLKPPHPVATAAYLATMQLNPNNHSIDASRATTAMEHEVLDQLAEQLQLSVEWAPELTQPPASARDRAVSCDVREADLDGLLAAILGPAGLAARRDDEHIRIVPAQPDP